MPEYVLAIVPIVEIESDYKITANFAMDKKVKFEINIEDDDKLEEFLRDFLTLQNISNNTISRLPLNLAIIRKLDEKPISADLVNPHAELRYGLIIVSPNTNVEKRIRDKITQTLSNLGKEGEVIVAEIPIYMYNRQEPYSRKYLIKRSWLAVILVPIPPESLQSETAKRIITLLNTSKRLAQCGYTGIIRYGMLQRPDMKIFLKVPDQPSIRLEGMQRTGPDNTFPSHFIFL